MASCCSVHDMNYGVFRAGLASTPHDVVGIDVSDDGGEIAFSTDELATVRRWICPRDTVRLREALAAEPRIVSWRSPTLTVYTGGETGFRHFRLLQELTVCED